MNGRDITNGSEINREIIKGQVVSNLLYVSTSFLGCLLYRY